MMRAQPVFLACVVAAWLSAPVVALALDRCEAGSLTVKEDAADDCPGCIAKSLMITDPTVVGDATRPPANDVWTFGHLVREMAGATRPGMFVLNWFNSFSEVQVINGFKVQPRPHVRELVIERWKSAQGMADASDNDWANAIDFSKSPFRLTAIIYRPDLARIGFDGSKFTKVRTAGEGRFVFQVMDAAGSPLPFTVIFEYELVADDGEDLQHWAKRWKSLSELDFGATYNAALAKITRAFTDQHSELDRFNNAAISQIRTNEVPPNLSLPWELREFRLGPAGRLLPSTVKMTPDLSFNNGTERAKLEEFIRAAVRGVEAPASPKVADGEFFLIPWRLNGQKFLAGSALTPIEFVTADKAWLSNSTKVKDADRLWLSFNTCNGCHGTDGMNTAFTHIDLRGDRDDNEKTTLLSDFLCESDLPVRQKFLMEFSDTPGNKLLTSLVTSISPSAADGKTGATELSDIGRFIIERQTRVH